MDFSMESVRWLVAQVPGWQLGLFGCAAVYALWKHRISHLLAALVCCFYIWLTYRCAVVGFDTLGEQTSFGLLVGGGVATFMLMIYFLFICDDET